MQEEKLHLMFRRNMCIRMASHKNEADSVGGDITNSEYHSTHTKRLLLYTVLSQFNPFPFYPHDILLITILSTLRLPSYH